MVDTLATLMVCCSMASWMLVLSASRMLLNSSMQQMPPSDRTRAPASSCHSPLSWSSTPIDTSKHLKDFYLDSGHSKTSTGAANASGQHRAWSHFGCILQELGLGSAFGVHTNIHPEFKDIKSLLLYLDHRRATSVTLRALWCLNHPLAAN